MTRAEERQAAYQDEALAAERIGHLMGFTHGCMDCGGDTQGGNEFYCAACISASLAAKEEAEKERREPKAPFAVVPDGAYLVHTSPGCVRGVEVARASGRIAFRLSGMRKKIKARSAVTAAAMWDAWKQTDPGLLAFMAAQFVECPRCGENLVREMDGSPVRHCRRVGLGWTDCREGMR